MRMAVECVEKTLTENAADTDANDKRITARNRAETTLRALQGLEIVAGLASKADAHEAHVRKLAEGLLASDDDRAPRVVIQEASLDDDDAAQPAADESSPKPQA